MLSIHFQHFGFINVIPALTAFTDKNRMELIVNLENKLFSDRYFHVRYFHEL